MRSARSTVPGPPPRTAAHAVSSPSATEASSRRRSLTVEADTPTAVPGSAAHKQAHEERQEQSAEAAAVPRDTRRDVADGHGGIQHAAHDGHRGGLDH